MTKVSFDKVKITEKDYNFIISNYILSQTGEFRVNEIKEKLVDLIILKPNECNYITMDISLSNKDISLNEIQQAIDNKIEKDKEKLDRAINLAFERLIEDDFIMQTNMGYIVRKI